MDLFFELVDEGKRKPAPVDEEQATEFVKAHPIAVWPKQKPPPDDTPWHKRLRVVLNKRKSNQSHDSCFCKSKDSVEHAAETPVKGRYGGGTTQKVAQLIPEIDEKEVKWHLRDWRSTATMVFEECGRLIDNPSLFPSAEMRSKFARLARHSLSPLAEAFPIPIPLRTHVQREFQRLKDERWLQTAAKNDFSAALERARPGLNPTAYSKDPWAQFLEDEHLGYNFEWPQVPTFSASKHILPPAGSAIIDSWRLSIDTVYRASARVRISLTEIITETDLHEIQMRYEAALSHNMAPNTWPPFRYNKLEVRFVRFIYCP